MMTDDNRIDGNPGYVGAEFVVPGHTLHVIEQPEMSGWRCELFGMGPTGIVWHPRKGQEPNWFWRWTQRLVFGNRWYRIKADD